MKTKTNKTLINISIDKALKLQVEEMFADVGLNLTSATILFYKQAVRQGKIPFEILLDPMPQSLKDELRELSSEPYNDYIPAGEVREQIHNAVLRGTQTDA
ncbi:MAG: type II toxin-antitoxin system RelB/DinJ family antitoxin [Oscillospiraceae bacterium]|jgi:addiction module RelB/DinJ family antitoxin|nr:type II toxin-antitoxin system RelB/DinJ family antitoxin [Oscillospiraceae bacterium]